MTPEAVASREATAKAAVNFFLEEFNSKWQSLTEMAHNNPGFDIKAIAFDGEEEFIEIKGQSGSWSEDGVILTPTELKKAIQTGDRYWLFVVEYAKDPSNRQGHLIQNPFKRINEFRFDSGLKNFNQFEEN